MQVESALGPALQAAYTVMQDYGGKMLVFQNAVPSLGMVFLLSLMLTRLSEQVEGLGALLPNCPFAAPVGYAMILPKSWQG